MRLVAGDNLTAPTDQLFVPTYIDDIAHAIEVLMRENASGIYHVVGSETVSPYTAACAIADTFGYDKSAISKSTFAQYFSGRAPRPQQAVLKHDKITKLGIIPKTFHEGLKDIYTREKET
jgi:dTDP-4-dehydrorhamnose reductase